MTKLKAIILGTGSISHTHVSAISETKTIELAACWNRVEDKKLGEEFSQKYNVKYYSSIDEIIEQEKPDITINALPYKYHELGIEKAAKQGSHLVVEKPMGISIKACQNIINIANENNIKLAVSEAMQFNPINLKFQDLHKKFGKAIHMIDTNYRDYFSPTRAAWAFDPIEGFGGMIFNVGVHRVARLSMLANAEPYSVTASTGKLNYKVEGDACIMIRYKNNTTGIIMMCGYHKIKDNSINTLRVTTEQGYCSIGKEILFYDSAGEQQIYQKSDSTNEYTKLYQTLATSIINNDNSLENSAKNAMNDVAVILAAFKSSQEKREVTLDEIFSQ